MDRSYLFDPQVIAAARAFVCVRLATYEDAAEGAFLKALVPTRSGELENSVFSILGADGKTRLVRPARSPRHDFATARALAERMQQLAHAYRARPAVGGAAAELPRVTNVRLALDVAACDNQPLVILRGPAGAERQRLEGILAELAWQQEFLGRFVYAVTADAAELANIAGAPAGNGVLVVQHDQFGLKGKLLAHAPAPATAEQVAVALRRGLNEYQRYDKSFKNHVFTGHRLGVFWETVIPVTDPEERNARERGKRK